MFDARQERVIACMLADYLPNELVLRIGQQMSCARRNIAREWQAIAFGGLFSTCALTIIHMLLQRQKRRSVK